MAEYNLNMAQSFWYKMNKGMPSRVAKDKFMSLLKSYKTKAKWTVHPHGPIADSYDIVFKDKSGLEVIVAKATDDAKVANAADLKYTNRGGGLLPANVKSSDLSLSENMDDLPQDDEGLSAVQKMKVRIQDKKDKILKDKQKRRSECRSTAFNVLKNRAIRAARGAIISEILKGKSPRNLAPAQRQKLITKLKERQNDVYYLAKSMLPKLVANETNKIEKIKSDVKGS